MTLNSYDVVIVGGGTAGLILAARLTEDPDLQVAVLEAGEDRTADRNVQTPSGWPLLRNSDADWAFQSSSETPHGAKPLSVAQGRMLGGTTGINGLVFQPTTRSNLDFWTQLGNKGWGYDVMDEALRRAVTIHSANTSDQGSGPVHLVENESVTEVNWVNAWADSLAKLGHSKCDPFSDTQRGLITNLDTVDPASNKRSFTANAYLDPVKSRQNLAILTGLTVRKILFSDASAPDGSVKADAVLVVSNTGDESIIKAGREIIISAGVVNSPRLLEISGIGDKSRLERLGIDVVVDNPYVGENFQNHSFSGITLPVRDDVNTLDAFLRKDPDALAAAEKTFNDGKGGPLGRSSTLASIQMSFSEVTDAEGAREAEERLEEATKGSQGPSKATPAFAKAWETYMRDNLQCETDAPGRFMFFANHAAFEGPATEGNYFSIVVMLSTPYPRGSVHINTSSSEHLNQNTGMDLNMSPSANPLDVEVLARYVMFADKTLSRLEPFASLLKPRKDRFESFEETKEYVRSTTGWTHHFVGSCSMMPKEMGGVVDDQLRVYGCSNLRVCDASVIPVVPRSNCQSVVYALAEHGSQIIKETLVR